MAEEAKKQGGKERVRKPREEWGRQSYPILSETAGERIYMAEPINETCWAYMKLLREHDKTKKIYPVDPYAEVYQFRDNLYAILTESLDGMGDSWMYLIIGPEKALLVDTSFGLGNLKGLCEELAPGKEILVANTHFHFDHAYGNAQFDKVYCHEYEYPIISKQDEHLWDYLFEEGTGRGIWAEFPREDIIKFKPYELIACPDGYQINLGGDYNVELVHMGGHSAGHAGFLDPQGKFFIAGDDIISMRVGIGGPRPGFEHGECASVTTMRNALRKLSKRMDLFTHVFTGHFVTDLESQVILSMLDACEAVCKDPEGAATYKKESPRGVQYFRYVEGLGMLCYTRAAVLPE